MNERIREFILQCTDTIEVVNEDSGITYHREFFDHEKFAELIVRECLMVCKKTEQYEVGNQDPDEVGCIRAGGVFCREDIKKHFGVDE